MFGQLKTEVKNRVVDATVSLFSHGPQPLEHTLDHMGDPGLLGPDSVSWPVIGDVAAFVGGVRALLIQVGGLRSEVDLVTPIGIAIAEGHGSEIGRGVSQGQSHGFEAW